VHLNVQDVDMAQVLARTVAAARAADAAAQIELSAPSGLHVEGDADRLAQAVDNLLANAVRHGRAPVRVTVQRVEDRVEISVSDSGPGVEPSVRDRLFQRFATGGTRGGTGLGLFIVRELARAYGGDARYEPEPAPSGRFVLSLLAATAASRPAPIG
jgi:signal transduction histidine kinase